MRMHRASAPLIALATLSLAALPLVAQGRGAPRAEPDFNVSSDPLVSSFHFRSIGPASMGGRVDDIEAAPSNPNVQVLGPNTATFSWTKGVNTIWLCVDTAFNTDDLFSLTGSWSNHACGTKNKTFTAGDLICGRSYVYRIYGMGIGIGGGSGYSPTGAFTTPPCTH